MPGRDGPGCPRSDTTRNDGDVGEHLNTAFKAQKRVSLWSPLACALRLNCTLLEYICPCYALQFQVATACYWDTYEGTWLQHHSLIRYQINFRQKPNIERSTECKLMRTSRSITLACAIVQLVGDPWSSSIQPHNPVTIS